MTPSHREFNPDHIPLAFMITLRAHGTWLHGDPRGSVDRFHNQYGTPRLPSHPARRSFERGLMKTPPGKADCNATRGCVSGHSRDLQDSELGSAGPQCSKQSCAQCSHGELPFKESTRRVEGKRHPDDARVWLLGQCPKPLEWRRKQAVHLDRAAADRSD
jgi:hypothetical protein